MIERVWIGTSENDAFAELIDRHTTMVHAISLSILRNKADAEDATQTSFLRLWKNRWRLAFVADERAFLARIAQRTAIDVLRTRKKEEPLDFDSASSRNEHAQTELARELASLTAAIRSLPDELRQVMELQQSGELTSDEMGKVLGIPAATVRSRAARARHMLRESLKGGGHERSRSPAG